MNEAETRAELIDPALKAADRGVVKGSRVQRVEAHRDLIYSGYDDKQQAFLDFVLAQYISEGVGELQPDKLPHLLELKYQALDDARTELGEPTLIRDLFIDFQRHLFTPTRSA